MKRYRRRLLALTALMAIYAQVAIVRPALLAIVVDCVGRSEEDTQPRGNFLRHFETAWRLVFPADWEPPTRDVGTDFFISFGAIFAIVGLVAGIVFFWKEYIAQRLIVRMLVDTRMALFQHLTRQSVSYFHARRTGDILSRVTNDVNLVQGSLRSIYESLLQQPWMIIAGLAGAFIAQPLLFVCATPLLLILVYPVLRSGQKIFRHSRKRQQRLGIITEALQQLFGGIRIVKAFGMEDRECRGFAEKNQEFERSYMKVRRARIMARSLQEVVFNLILATLLIAGAWLLIDRHVTPGDFVGFCAALAIIYEPIKKLSKSWNQINESRPGIERILEVLRHEPKVVDRDGAVDFPGKFDVIRLENVSFTYSRETEASSASASDADAALPEALSDVNLEVRAGDVVALVGSSGSGKSTLVDLIARFHDVTSGKITIDGVDVRDFRHRSFLNSIGIVSQDPFLFNTTIRENIRHGREDATDEQIIAAARVANAHAFIEEQPDGYDTVIGERGGKLSGGQRQRVTIARAVLKDAPILILDEATSALDSEVEREVQAGIENLLRERTSLVVAHRLSTIANANRIVVLDEGRIVEVGTHAELLDARGRYHELYTTQNRDA